MKVQSQNSAATVLREKEFIASKSFRLSYSESKKYITKQPTQNSNFTELFVVTRETKFNYAYSLFSGPYLKVVFE